MSYEWRTISCAGGIISKQVSGWEYSNRQLDCNWAWVFEVKGKYEVSFSGTDDEEVFDNLEEAQQYAEVIVRMYPMDGGL